MSETVTLQIPDELARRARALAAATHRPFEDAVVDWLRRAVEEPAVESLPDDSLLALCDSMLSAADQDALTGLLAGHREGIAREGGDHAAGRSHDGLPAGVGPEGAGPEGSGGPRAPSAPG